MFPIDDVSGRRIEESAALIGVLARNGSHGHLSQILLSRQTGRPTFDALHPEL